MNFNITDEILQDTRNDKVKPWKEKKERSVMLADSFNRLDLMTRAERTSQCGSFLRFAECSTDGYKKLIQANFCKDRLCPMCNWRRSLMLHAQIMQILHVAVERQKQRFVFMTLTVKNVKEDELGNAITTLLEGFKQLFKYKDIDKFIVGWIRNLEINYDNEKHITKKMYADRKEYYQEHNLRVGDWNPMYQTYHPHIHVLMGVKPSYFSGGYYMTDKDWTARWMQAAKLDYYSQVWVEAVKPKRQGQTVEAAVAETAKYSVKDSDYLYVDDEALTDEVVSVLAWALKGRRLVAFGKLYRAIRKELKQNDVESDKADLVGSDGGCDCPICSSTLEEQLYEWDFKMQNYIKSKNQLS